MSLLKVRARELVIALFLTSATFTGCGTISDWGEPYGPRVYGGVRWDLDDKEGCVRTSVWLGIWDVPFSLILDTLLLPYSVIRSM